MSERASECVCMCVCMCVCACVCACVRVCVLLLHYDNKTAEYMHGALYSEHQGVYENKQIKRYSKEQARRCVRVSDDADVWNDRY